MEDQDRVRKNFPGVTMTRDEMAGLSPDSGGGSPGYLVWSARQHGYLLGSGSTENAAWADASEMIALGMQRVLCMHPLAKAAKVTPRKEETRYVVWTEGVRKGIPLAVGDSEVAAWAAAACHMSRPAF